MNDKKNINKPPPIKPPRIQISNQNDKKSINSENENYTDWVFINIRELIKQ